MADPPGRLPVGALGGQPDPDRLRGAHEEERDVVQTGTQTRQTQVPPTGRSVSQFPIQNLP